MEDHKHVYKNYLKIEIYINMICRKLLKSNRTQSLSIIVILKSSFHKK